MAETEEQEEQRSEVETEEEEQKAEDAELKSVDSTMVSEIAWDEGTLTVVFQNEKEETYLVDDESWKNLKEAPSVGKWMHDNVL